MFEDRDELRAYVVENYVEVTRDRINDSHWDLECNKCKVTRGFQVVSRQISGTMSEYGAFSQDFDAPHTYIFRCPVCKSFKQWVVYQFQLKGADGKWQQERYFRVTSVPNDGLEEIAELPESPASLRTAYKQAIRAMDANANIAAAVMFRRAVQIITRDLLGAKPSRLANELNEVVGKSYNGATVTTNFAKIGYIIKEVGNQGAHADKDPDLLDFTTKDAEDLQEIFMELVSELFIVPAAAKKAREEFLARRKVSLPGERTPPQSS
jgi:hypothetical protein